MTSLIRQYTQCAYFLVICMIAGCGSGDSLQVTDKTSPIKEDIYFEIWLGSRIIQVPNDREIPQIPDGGHKGEEIIFFINGHPRIHRWKSHIHEPINTYLRQGANEVSFSEPPKATAYLQIIRRTNGSSSVVIQKMITPRDDSSTLKWSFQSPVSFALKCDILPIDSEKERAEMRKQILEIVQNLHKSIRERRAEFVADSLLDGYRKMAPMLTDKPDQKIAAIRENWVEYFRKHGSECRPIDKDALNLVFGRSSIYVYAGWFTDSANANTWPYLFEFTDATGKQPDRLWGLRFCRVDGKWIIYENKY